MFPPPYIYYTGEIALSIELRTSNNIKHNAL